MKNFLMQVWSVVGAVLAFTYSMGCAALATPAFLIYPPIGHAFRRAFGWGWCLAFGIRVTYIDLHKLPKASVLASNHESVFDIFVLARLPVAIRWIAKKEISRIPLIGQVMWAMGSYMVARDRSGGDIRLMQKLEDDLAKDETSVIVFPEGTRSRTGELLPFKKGAFRTAQNSGCYLVPIGISGTFAICPAGKLPTFGHKVIVRIGDPMKISKEESIDDAIERYRTNLLQLLEANKSLVS